MENELIFSYPLRFLEPPSGIKTAKILLVGFPYDGTSSFRAGARFAPNAIREASRNLETFSPLFNLDLEELSWCDVGDLVFSNTEPERVVHTIYEFVQRQLESGKVLIGMGGEHLVTVGIVKAYSKFYDDLHVIQLDAHADLRELYLGQRFSHATAIKRIVDFIPSNRLIQIGVRSGTREEFQWMKTYKTRYSLKEASKKILSLKKPCYLSIDMDVFDPAFCPGVSTPEPIGLSSHEVFNFLHQFFRSVPIVGADVVEICPPFDPSGISVSLAGKLIRELLFTVSNFPD
jgi:agmatinase